MAVIKESVRQLVNEIGDTPRGNFAVNAVRGRAAARPRYHNHEYNSVSSRAKQNRILDMADDEAWKNGQGMYHNEAGYNYGYQKGIEG